MRTELACLNHCAVPFLRSVAANLCWYYYAIYIDPLSDGAVTPPLGVEKLSPRLNFIDNMFSCIT